MTVQEHLYHQCLESFRGMNKDDQSLAIFTMLSDIENNYKNELVSHLIDQMKSNLISIDDEIGVVN